MKLEYTLRLVLSFVVFILTGSSALAAEGLGRVFRVGAIVPLTGALADYGAAVRNGFELARGDYADNFRGIEIVYEDSGYDGKTALNALNALIARGDIDLYYVWGVTPNETLLPVLAARQLPVISETSLKSSLIGRPLAVRAAPTGDMTARVLSEELLKRGYRSVGMLVVDIPYYRDIVDALRRYLAKGGASLEVVDSIAPELTDFKTLIAKLRSQNHAVLGVFLLPDQIVTFYRQAETLRFKVPTFGASIHDNQELIKQAGSGAEGALLIGYDVTDAFRSRWVKVFGSDARMGSGANAYDTAHMIADLFGSGVGLRLSAADTIARFKEVKLRHGVSGDFGFADTSDGGKHFDFPLSGRIVRDGEIVVAK